MSVMNDMEEEMYQLRITIDNLTQQRDELLEALKTLEIDNHTYQTRPCPTCREITKTLGRPFGCNTKERDAAIAKVKP